MKIDFVLKREGIGAVRALSTLEINQIARKVSDKLCDTFSEYDLNRTDLFISIARIKMYTAKMDDQSCKAKYYYKDNSIYFNVNFDLSNIETAILHECIHSIQDTRDKFGNILHFGLCDTPSDKAFGVALNEATVQLMASVASDCKLDSVKYYAIHVPTISSTDYTLECNLVNQLAQFTGTYPLYHSALYGDNLFKNTLIAKTDEKIYYQIVSDLDTLLELEKELYFIIDELKYTNGNESKIRRINKEIENGKKLIKEQFYKVQDNIILNGFTKEFNNIKNLADITAFKMKLYEYKNLIGYSDDYTFYNDFYCSIMNELEKKVEYIKQYGSIDLLGSLTPGMAIIPKVKKSVSLFRRILQRVGILAKNEE